MVVPHAARRQDEVAALHGAFLAVDDGEGAFALDDDARRARRVLVRRRLLAREQQLEADIDRGRDLHRALAAAGIVQHQHAALGLLDRRQLAGLEQQRADALEAPQRRLRHRVRPVVRQDVAHHRPERRDALAFHGLPVVGGKLLEGAELGGHEASPRDRPIPVARPAAAASGDVVEAPALSFRSMQSTPRLSI